VIRPNLFIGLGTTGTKILKYLRRLVFEEFERAGLPIFRYIAIETDADETGEDPGLRSSNNDDDGDTGQGTNWASCQRIHVIRTVIPDTTAIEHKIALGDPLYNEHLASWLNPALLKIGTRSFQAGANNIRMAGRLCLWENWPAVSGTLSTLLGAITAPDNIKATQDFLIRHFQRKGANVPDRLIDPVPDVYIVGSLCGGTCSGMMIDAAYYIRHIIGSAATTTDGDVAGAANSNIYGIFTMYSPQQAASIENQVRSANCYGTLWELNFYNHTETSYNVTFPGGVTTGEVKDPPFDYMMFVSRTGKEQNVEFTTPDGRFDEEGLNQMVSLNLFADVIGDAGGEKNAIRTDWWGHDEFRQPKPVRQGETPLMMRCLSSFGLTAVWYPKYRIATAAACRIGSNVCANWLRPCENKLPIEDAAQGAWESVLDTNVDRLTSPDVGQPLKTEIENLLSQAQNVFARSSSADALVRMMRAYPQGESFSQRFGKNGQYYDIIDKQTPLFKDALKTALGDMLRNQVNKIDFEGQYSLDEVKYFFEVVDGEIQNYIEDCPTRLPALDVSRLDASNLQKAEQNRWLSVIGLKEQSIKQHKDKFIEDYRKLVLDTYVNLRNFFLRPVLEELKEEIGISAQADDDKYEERTTIKRLLDAIEATLKSCASTLEQNYRDEVNPPKQINVEIVANNDDNNIEREAERLSSRIAPADASVGLLDDKTFIEFLRQGQESILLQIKEVYRRFALRQIESFHVVSKAQETLATGRENPVALLARRSNPYQKYNGLYKPANIPTRPNLICGHNPTPNALKNLQTALANQGYTFDRISESTVEHLLLLYKEEGAFAVDDLEAFRMLRTRFNQCPGPYGHLTHQDPMFYDVEYAIRKQKLHRWMQAVQELMPPICQQIPEAFQNVFKLYVGEGHKRLYYEYRIDENELPSRIFLENDQAGIDNLARAENKFGYEKFIHSVQMEFKQIGQGDIVPAIQALLANLPPEEYTNRRNFYQEFLNEVFSGDIITPPQREAKVIQPTTPIIMPTPEPQSAEQEIPQQPQASEEQPAQPTQTMFDQQPQSEEEEVSQQPQVSEEQPTQPIQTAFDQQPSDSWPPIPEQQSAEEDVPQPQEVQDFQPASTPEEVPPPAEQPAATEEPVVDESAQTPEPDSEPLHPETEQRDEVIQDIEETEKAPTVATSETVLLEQPDAPPPSAPAEAETEQQTQSDSIDDLFNQLIPPISPVGLSSDEEATAHSETESQSDSSTPDDENTTEPTPVDEEPPPETVTPEAEDKTPDKSSQKSSKIDLAELISQAEKNLLQSTDEPTDSTSNEKAPD